MKLSMGLALLALPLMAGPALRIAAVERKGWPPFEDDRRVYRIEGEAVARLRVGEKLILQRPGTDIDPGRLKVAVVAPGFVEAYLDRPGSTYPLRGDVAEPGQGLPLPPIPAVRIVQDLLPAQPRLQPPPDPPAPVQLPSRASAHGTAPAKRSVHNLAPAESHGRPAVGQTSEPAPVHPRLLEPVYFLEGDGALSPKGREKLGRIVETWGADGAWSLSLPEDRILPARIREARIQAVRRALRNLGVQRLEVRAAELQPGDRGDVLYVARD